MARSLRQMPGIALAPEIISSYASRIPSFWDIGVVAIKIEFVADFEGVDQKAGFFYGVKVCAQAMLEADPHESY